VSNRNNQQRRVARRFKRTQRATQHHQRGDATVVACFVLLAVILAMVAGLSLNRSGRINGWISRCNAAGGLAVRVQDIGDSRLYCVRRDVLVPEEGRTL